MNGGTCLCQWSPTRCPIHHDVTPVSIADLRGIWHGWFTLTDWLSARRGDDQ